MNKPFHLSRKFRTAIVASAAALAALYGGGENGHAYAAVVVTLAGLLIHALGLEDTGKASKALEIEKAIELAEVLKSAKEQLEKILALKAEDDDEVDSGDEETENEVEDDDEDPEKEDPEDGAS